MLDDHNSTASFNVKPQRFPKIDLTGKRYGKLTVVGFAEYRGPSQAYWQCRCDCSNTHIASGMHLKSQRIKSCGCSRRTWANKAKIPHGKTGTKIYTKWAGMMQRCYDQNGKSYKHYGGRGIKVSNEWHLFETFAADMGEPPEGMTLERRDNNGNYSKENCFWETYEGQANNKRNNHLLTFQGIAHTLANWAKLRELSPRTLYSRLSRGWSVEDAITKPLQANKYREKSDDELLRLARAHGISADAVRKRIARGWTQERALTTPTRKSTRR